MTAVWYIASFFKFKKLTAWMIQLIATAMIMEKQANTYVFNIILHRIYDVNIKSIVRANKEDILIGKVSSIFLLL